MNISKKTVYMVILILVIVLIAFYFLNEFNFINQDKTKLVDQEKELVKIEYSDEVINLSQDEIYDFKILKDNLSPDMVEQYQIEFEQIVESLKKLDKNNVNLALLNNLAMLKKAVGDYDGARKIFEYTNYNLPNNSLSYFNLANLYAEDIRNNEKAEENFLMAIQNSAGEGGNEQYYRGVASFYKYFYPEKIDRLEKILLDALEDVKYSQNQDVMALLADYYGRVGEKEKALEYWNKVLVLDPENQGVKNEINKLK